ncbi:hypothetical protein MMC14_004863 [Varicellaria rhodocarpa]|nr:hypothetical protein [Varicellaria rhodocarpa]
MSETLSQCGSRPRDLLYLPLEVREKIYFHLLLRSAVFVQGLQFEVDPWIRSMWETPEQLAFFDDMEDIIPKRTTGVLSVSRQISEEALNVLYSRNLFIVNVHGGAYRKLLRFGTANLRRIRHLQLVLQPMGICYPEPMKFDFQLWIPLLAGLSQLCLVAQQPLRAGGYYNASSLEEDMQKYVAWLEPILQYLAQNVPETTIVRIDDGNLMETGRVMETCFHSGYEKVQTETGDRIFERGVFSREGEYWEDDGSGMNFADGGMGEDWSD